MENTTLDNDLGVELALDDQSRVFLRETAKWAKFLAIVGFVMAGLMALAGIFMGTFLSSMDSMKDIPFPASIISVIYIGFAILYVMPMLYMYRFSTKVQFALINNNQPELTTAFENLKSLFKFFGILTAIFLGFYALAFVVGIIGTVFMAAS